LLPKPTPPALGAPTTWGLASPSVPGASEGLAVRAEEPDLGARIPRTPPTSVAWRVWPAALVGALVLSLAMPRVAHAEPCETTGVTADGACVDALTLAFCDEARDEAVTIPCPDGEICAELSDRPGFYVCIDRAQTPCADIPLTGKCTTGDATLFCHEGKAVLTPCPDGTVCSIDADTMAPECVSAVFYEDAGSVTPTSDADAEPNTDERDASPGPTPETYPDAGLGGAPDAGPSGPRSLPSVDRGPAYRAQGGGTSGCSGGPGHSPSPLGWALLLLGLLWARRRPA